VRDERVATVGLDGVLTGAPDEDDGVVSGEDALVA
jgi:hypothetical protein